MKTKPFFQRNHFSRVYDVTNTLICIRFQKNQKRSDESLIRVLWRNRNSNLPRSSRPEVSCKKGVLRNFTKFT